ncbi:MAG: hypothetical protein DRP86_06150 [Candidatus Neomarinimicrobiota bacterium]|nr:MAG: hypothetical protein DRP86_06150 [Candidatus Neomarinimicrobiota bacterium]
MKKIYVTTLIILTTLMLVSCAGSKGTSGSKGKPIWVDNPAAAYPEKDYLAARGAGDTRQAAEDNASGNLARIFKSEISVDQTTRERYSAFTKLGGSMDETLQTDMDQIVKVLAGETLFNVKFSETYTDEMGRVHVLAYLDRKETADIYRDKINANYEKIEFLLKDAESASNPVDRYALLNAAHAISTINQAMLEQLNFIHPASHSMLTAQYDAINHNSISKKRAEAAKALTFSVNISGDDGRVASMTSETISRMGFPLVSNNAVVRIVGAISYEDVDLQRENMEFVGWNLNLKVTGPDGSVFVELDAKGREGGMSKEAAKRIALREIEKNVGKKLEKQLTEYFDNRLK